MIAVQLIEIGWTKARGAPRANERALLPRALTLLHAGAPARRIAAAGIS